MIMNCNRRTAITFLTMGAANLLLAGCTQPTAVVTTGSPVTPSPSQVATRILQDVDLIATGFSNALPALVHDPKIPAGALAKLEVITYQIQAASATLSVGMSKVSAQPTILQIEALVNEVVTIAAGLPLPPAIAVVFQAGAVLLPLIEAGVGLAISAPTPALQSRILAPAMTPTQARLILKAETAL